VVDDRLFVFQTTRKLQPLAAVAVVDTQVRVMVEQVVEPRAWQVVVELMVAVGEHKVRGEYAVTLSDLMALQDQHI
jgi:hypothetical protein